MERDLIYRGKVRDVFMSTDEDELLMVQSNRCSAFNHHICNITGKGNLLTKTAEWWFNNTRHIIPNHMLSVEDNKMTVKRCIPIKLEFVVRRFITGSLWRHYSSDKEDNRLFCGMRFSDGLTENARLARPAITPTLKNENDDPTSVSEIINKEILTKEQWFYIRKKTLELFEFGEKIANDAGYLLVDTKYEFGFNNGEIILMDEIHTADSSRYWVKDTYIERFQANQSPEKFDKDIIRNYISQNGLKDDVESGIDIADKIPTEIKYNLIKNYSKLLEDLTNSYTSNSSTTENDTNNTEYKRFFTNCSRVIIIAGSVSDKWHVDKLVASCIDANLEFEVFYSSAHKNTLEVMNILTQIEEVCSRVVWITVAGMSNALSGVIAANSKFPVIACPPFKDKCDIQIDINSSLRCPSGVPVMTVLSVGNAVESCRRILAL